MSQPVFPRSFIQFGKRLFKRSDVERYKAEIVASSLNQPVEYPNPPAFESFVSVRDLAAEIGSSTRSIHRRIAESEGRVSEAE